MKRKTVGILMLGIVCVLGATSFTLLNNRSVQKDDSYKVIYEQKQITNIKTLFSMANQSNRGGISTMSTNNVKSPDIAMQAKVIITDKKTKKKITSDKVYYVTQLLKDEKNDKGQEKKTYSKTCFYKFDTKDIENNMNTSINPSTVGTTPTSLKFTQLGSWSDSMPDSTGGVVAYGTVNWQNTYSGGNTFIAISSVNGGWDLQDGTETLSGMYVYVGEEGVGLDGKMTGTAKEYYPSFTYNYATSSYCPYISTTAGAYGYGMSTAVTIHRGASSWGLNLSIGQGDY